MKHVGCDDYRGMDGGGGEDLVGVELEESKSGALVA